MKNLLYIFSFCYSVLLLSCNQRNSVAEQITLLNSSDTLRYEFPKTNKGFFDSSLYKDNVFFSKSLNLESLEKGFDSIQLRIFYGGSFVGERLVILRNKSNKWDAEISTITYVENPDFNEIKSLDYHEKFLPKRTIEYKTPKSGWDKFIQKIFEYNILIIPDDNDIKDYKEDSFSDRNLVKIEIATKNVYRVYTSREMDLINKEYPEIQDVSKILKVLDQEFSLNQLWDYRIE